jgi:peptidoglycan/LPS O-acetylase OafA/YrhL
MTSADHPSGVARKPFHVPSLDGVRALAILIVMGSHCKLPRIMPGTIAVSGFFLVSGYLITTLLRREFARTGTLRFGEFYRRRALRILPPMYITLALAALAWSIGLIPGELHAAPVLSQLLCANNYWQILFGNTGMPEGTSIYWYVAIQEQFYLIFPFVLLWLLRRCTLRTNAAVFAVWCAIALAWRCLLVFGLNVTDDMRTYIAVDTRFDAILIGCILALWNNPVLDPVPGLRARTKVGLAAAAIVLLFAASVNNTQPWRETVRYSLHSMALLPLIYLAIVDAERPWFRWLEWRPVRYLGSISYALYLVHYVVLFIVTSLWPTGGTWPRAAIVFAISIAYAAAMRRWVEDPLGRFRKSARTVITP